MAPEAIEVLEPKVGRKVHVELTGQVFAMHRDGTPVLLDLPGLGPSFALFGSAEDLREYMRLIDVTGYRIKQVNDGPEFMQSQIPFPIVCNMRFESALNKSKWSLVMPTERT